MAARRMFPTGVARVVMWVLLLWVLPSLASDSSRMILAAASSAAAGPWRSIRDSLHAARPHLLAAATARLVSISACYPLDTIKTRLQMSAASETAGILKGGVAGLYSGMGSSLLGQVPYGTLTFGSYEMYKGALLKRFPGVPRAVTFCAAAILGDATGAIWLVPSEVVKIKMQGGLYTSLPKAAMAIFRAGGIGGFYQGFGAELVRDAPFRAIQLTSYELLRGAFQNWRKNSTGKAKLNTNINSNSNFTRNRKASRGRRGNASAAISGTDAAVLGGVAGAISATFTCPLDVIRTRLMVGAPAASPGVEAVAQTWGGAIKAGGLFAGIGIRIFYIGTSSAVFFLVYEATKARLSNGDFSAERESDQNSLTKGKGERA